MILGAAAVTLAAFRVTWFSCRMNLAGYKVSQGQCWNESHLFPEVYQILKSKLSYTPESSQSSVVAEYMVGAWPFSYLLMAQMLNHPNLGWPLIESPCQICEDLAKYAFRSLVVAI